MIRGGMMYKQLDVVFTPFPYSDLSGSKKRPAIIISNGKLDNSEDVICCLITSRIPKLGILIEEDAFEEDNLPFKSWIKHYRIFTVNKGTIVKRLAKVKNSYYNKIFYSICSYIK